jgi:hypothetical protein
LPLVEYLVRLYGPGSRFSLGEYLRRVERAGGDEADEPSSTTPTPSWPGIVPSFMPAIVPLIMCRSVPQIALEVSRTTASVGSCIVGSGTSSSLMSPTPWKTTASS